MKLMRTLKLPYQTLNNATISTDLFTGTIIDDDDPPVASIVTNYSVREDSGANDKNGLVVTLTPASTKTVEVNYVFSDGSAINNTNYSGTNDTLTFTPVNGLTPTTKFIPFSIIDNSDQNASKTFRITLSIPAGGNARTMNNTNEAIVTINDDDSLPKIKIATDYEFISPGLPLTFTVSIEPKNQTPVTVPITARDETNAILDFLPSTLIVGTSGTLTAKVATFPNSTGNLTITLGNVTGYISDPPLMVPIETPLIQHQLLFQVQADQ